MVRNNEGLTKTYNRFHDPNERSPEILKLRELHDAMDRAVLDAYGWTDLVPTCEFLLDYEEDEDDEASRRAARSPGATAGPMRSATKCWPACSNSTNSAPNRNAWQDWQPKPPQACPRDARSCPAPRRYGASSRPRTRYNRTCWAGESCCQECGSYALLPSGDSGSFGPGIRMQKLRSW